MKLLLGIDYGTGGCKVTAIGEDGSFAGREFYPDNYWFYPPAADKKNLEAFAPFIKD